jgi:hypothetical protein
MATPYCAAACNLRAVPCNATLKISRHYHQQQLANGSADAGARILDKIQRFLQSQQNILCIEREP